MLKGVIFDMDGVLVDSEPFHYDAEEIVFGRLGISVPDEERRGFVGKSTRLMWEEIREKHGLALPVDGLLDLDRAARIGRFSSLGDIEPIPGVIELLLDLAANGISLAVASSSYIEIIDILLKKTRLCTFFKTVVSGHSLERGKPYPDIFLHSARVLGVKASESIVIEDSANGVRAAKSAGMYCIGYRNPATRAQDLSEADMVIDDFHDVSFEGMRLLV